MTHQTRLQALKKNLENADCPTFIIDDKTNLFYMTGIEMSAGKLVVHDNSADLFVDSRYYELCQEKSPFPVHLVEAATTEEILKHPRNQNIRSLGFDAIHTAYKAFTQLETLCKQLNIRLIPLEDPISTLRMIKDSSEIQLLKDAGQLGSKGFDYVLSLLKEGITEIEVAQELEIYWKRQGSKGLAFDPIIAFGSNSSMPHYRASQRSLKQGDIVLIDIGVNLQHYHSDMTRTVFFGKSDPRLLEIYHIVKEAQQKALNACRPGVFIGELDRIARGYITETGYGHAFSHGLGHGVGLEIHEAPWVRNKPPHNNLPLEAGMTITIEPGIYLPQVGGVRIEDTVIITNDGHFNVTNRPKEALIV